MEDDGLGISGGEHRSHRAHQPAVRDGDDQDDAEPGR
jgi:hypothetical protein